MAKKFSGSSRRERPERVKAEKIFQKRPSEAEQEILRRQAEREAKGERTPSATKPRAFTSAQNPSLKASSDSRRRENTTSISAPTQLSKRTDAGKLQLSKKGRTSKTLDRVLSKAGLGSRTEARSWIGTGRVQVNGRLVQTPDHWVDVERDKITVDGKPLRQAEVRYILVYKPKGYITTYRDPEGRPTVYDLLPGVDQFVGTVGRLDLDTSGLLLLTNDTALAEAMTNPEYKLPKTYLVKASTLLSDEQIAQLARGVELDDGPTRPAIVHRQRDSVKYTFLELTITEGRNRQVRRMLEAIGSKVLKLVRTRLGPLSLEGLVIGGWRDLTADEVVGLRKGARVAREGGRVGGSGPRKQ